MSSLSASDVADLNRLVEAKAKIQDHIDALASLASVAVFDDLEQPQSETAFEEHDWSLLYQRVERLEKWEEDLDKTEASAQSLDLGEIDRMRGLAKAASERHMSLQDTDLLEVAVGTLVAFDKLTRKVHTRRRQLDLLASRVQWDLARKKCWQTFCSLAKDVADFVENRARWSTTIYHLRKDSTTGFNDIHSSATTLTHRSARQQTEEMRREAIQLNDRVRLFCSKLVPECSERLDQLIEQSQVPEPFLDEQDRIDDLGSMVKIRGKLLLEVAAQWLRSDELFRTLHTLHLDAKELAFSVKANQLDSSGHFSTLNRLDKLSSYLERLCGPSAAYAYLKDHSIPSRSLIKSIEHHIPQPRCDEFPFLDKHNEEVKRAISKELGAAANHVRTAMKLCRKHDDEVNNVPSSSQSCDGFSEASHSPTNSLLAHSRTTSLVKHGPPASTPMSGEIGSALDDHVSKSGDTAVEEDVFGSKTRLPSYVPVEAKEAGTDNSTIKNRIVALTRQFSAGPIEEQTEMDGLRQQQQYLSLPTQVELEELESDWRSKRVVADELLMMEPQEGIAKELNDLDSAIRKRDLRLSRFRSLAAFTAACARIESSQSSLLNLIDHLQGITLSAYDSNDDAEKLGPTVSGERGGRSPGCLSQSEHERAHITDELVRLSELFEVASAAADSVSQDKRVREELAKVRRSTKDLSAMAKEVLAIPTADSLVSEDEARETPSPVPSSIVSAAASSNSESESEGNAPSGGLSAEDHISSLASVRTQSPANDRLPGSLLTPRKAVTSAIHAPIRFFSEETPRAFPSSPLLTPRQSGVRQKSVSTNKSPHDVLPSRIPVLSPSKSASVLTPSTGRTPLQKRPNRYRANPKSKLDVAVSKVVNHLPMPVQISHASGEWRDESGRYWVGAKLCFCRILRSRTVMVRVGGGWQELSSYIGQHYAQVGGTTSIALTESPKGQPANGSHNLEKLPWVTSAASTPKASPSTSPAALAFLRTATDAELQKSPLARKKTMSFSSVTLSPTLSSSTSSTTSSPLRPRGMSNASPVLSFSRKPSDGLMPAADVFSSTLLPPRPSIAPSKEANDPLHFIRKDGSGPKSKASRNNASTPRARTSSRISPPALKVWRP